MSASERRPVSPVISLCAAVCVAAAVISAAVSCAPVPAAAQPAPSPASGWEALPQTPDQRVGVWTMCSHGVRVWLVVAGPNTPGAITTSGDPYCADAR